MPNPFIRYPANRGQAPTDRKQPVPEHETEETTNIPYLGSIDHGVAPLHERYNPELVPQDSSTEAKYEPEEDVAAIPVRVVKSDSSADTRLRWRSVNMPVPAQGNPPLRILSRNEQRTKAILENTDKSTSIYVSDLPDPYGYASTILAPGGRLEFSHTEEVYVLSTVTANANVGGWVNLVPRQVINGAQYPVGPFVSARKFTAAYVVMKVNSIAGTAPVITGILQAADWGGTAIYGNSLGATQSITAQTVVGITVNPLTADSVQGMLATGGANSVIDAELWAYFIPSGGSATPIVSVMQEYYVTMD